MTMKVASNGATSDRTKVQFTLAQMLAMFLAVASGTWVCASKLSDIEAQLRDIRRDVRAETWGKGDMQEWVHAAYQANGDKVKWPWPESKTQP